MSNRPFQPLPFAALLASILSLQGTALAAKQVNATVTPDIARAVTGTLTPTGGTLTAKAADGTVFTLAAPPNAVLSSLKVKMTPVSKLGGVKGAKGYVAAVHLEPEGMEFLEALTLKITAPQALSGKVTRGLNSHGLGQGLYYQPLSLSGRTATLKLMHFSNPGVADIPQEDLEIPVPVSARDKLETDLALIPDVPGVKEQKIFEVTTNYYGRRKDLLDHATQSDAALREAVREFLIWREWVKSLGMDQKFRPEIYAGWTKIAAGIDAAVARAHAECVVNNDFRRVIDILGWVSWVKRNPNLAPYFSGKMAGFEAKAVGCASFEVTFEMSLKEHSTEVNLDLLAEDVATVQRVQAIVPVAYNFKTNSLEGSGPLKMTEYTAQGFTAANIDGTRCTVKPGRQIDLIGQGFIVGSDNYRRSEIPLVSLLIEPNGRTTETSTVNLVSLPGAHALSLLASCSGASGREIGYAGAWPVLFAPLHDIDLESQQWWYVPLTFQNGTATYRRDHNHDGKPLADAEDDTFEGRRETIQGFTSLIMRHTPK